MIVRPWRKSTLASADAVVIGMVVLASTLPVDVGVVWTARLTQPLSIPTSAPVASQTVGDGNARGICC